MGRQSLKERFVLDTCTWIWIANGDARITSEIQLILGEADWLVSAISVWEVAMLAAKKRIELNYSIERWIDEALIKVPGLTLVPLSPEISVTSCHLKACHHSDPADRIIIATAIQHQATLVTADSKIIEYCNSQRLAIIKV